MVEFLGQLRKLLQLGWCGTDMKLITEVSNPRQLSLAMCQSILESVGDSFDPI